MMPNQFEVTVRSVEEVHTLPGIWSNESLRQLLINADLDDIGQVEDAELLDIVIMALQDLGHQQAGELVLGSVFGDAMRSGVRQNLVDDLQEDEPWQEFATVAQQRGLFIAVVLLQKAFPKRHSVPDALRFHFSIRALSSAAIAGMKASDPAWLMRLLSQGMSDTDVLNRLYEEELKTGPFTDATGMIWHFAEHNDQVGGEGGPETGLSRLFDVIAPRVWLGPLKKGMVFEAGVR